MGKHQHGRHRRVPACDRGSSDSPATRAPIDSGGVSWVSPDCPLAVAEQFWRQVQAVEPEDETVLFDRLKASGITLPAPDELDEARLSEKLWQVIGALAALGVYLHSTDHLSDFQLYAYLWNEALRTPATVRPDDFNFAYYVDIIGGFSHEDIVLFLKYYADDDTRESWAKEFADSAIPDREPPPFQRDRRLPHSRIEQNEED